MVFNTIGSSNPITDIMNARLWHYNDSAATDPTLGVLVSQVPNPWLTNFVFSAPYTGLTLSQKNYLWLTYDLFPTATICNYIDGDFLYFNLDTNVYMPSVTSPPGYQIVGPCGTGVGDDLLQDEFMVYPIPCNDEIKIYLNSKVNERVKIDLYTVTGLKLNTLFDGFALEDGFEINCPMKKYPAGIYYLNYLFKQKVITKKLIKL